MMRLMRQAASTWLMKGLFVLLVVCFALWGIGDFNNRGVDQVVATVDGTEITAEGLQSSLNMQRELLRRQLGPNYSPEIEKVIGLNEATLQQMINNVVLDQTAGEQGLVFGMSTIAQIIAQEPSFQDASGNFDQGRFNALLAQNGLSENEFFNRVQKEIQNKILSGAVMGGARSPEVTADSLYRFANEKRTARYFALPRTVAENIAAPDTDTLKRFYQDNAALYTDPEYRDFKLVMIRRADIAAEMTVPDRRLQEEYERQKADFTSPEKRRLEQVRVDDAQTAQTIVTKAREGDGFAAAVVDALGSIDRIVDLGAVTRQAVPLPELAEAAFATDQEGVLDPVETPVGWLVINVAEIQEEVVRSFEESREFLAEAIKNDMAYDALYDLSISLEDELSNGATLTEAANKLGLKTSYLKQIDKFGRQRDRIVPQELAGNPEIIQTVFTLDAGEISPVREVQNGDYYAIVVDDITPETLRPYEEVKDTVLIEWRARERRRLLEDVGATVVERLESGTPMEDLAADYGVEIKETRPITRENADIVIDLSPELLQNVFEAKAEGDAFTGMGRDDQQVVVQIADITDVSPEGDAELMTRLSDSLTRDYAQDLLSAFRQAQRDRMEIEINDESLRYYFPAWFGDEAEEG